MTCYCSRCVPNDLPKHPHISVCSRCGQEVRFGERGGRRTFLHREAVDHEAVLGHSMPLTRHVEVATEEQNEDAALQAAKVEVYAHPVSKEDFPAQSGLRQIANLVDGTTRVNPTTGKTSKAKNAVPAAPGWELVNITHARGPYRGSKGEVLSISDTHVLRARAVQLDGSVRIAVGSWRDLAFDFAFIGTIRDGLLEPRKVGSDEMKDWIKGHDVPDPVPAAGE